MKLKELYTILSGLTWNLDFIIVASLCFFYDFLPIVLITFHCWYRVFKNLRVVLDWPHQFTVEKTHHVSKRKIYANIFFSSTSRLWNSLLAYCFNLFFPFLIPVFIDLFPKKGFLFFFFAFSFTINNSCGLVAL